MSLILAGPYTVIPVPTQRGFGTAYCRKQTGRWSPVNGWTFDQDFNGLSLANMQALANVYQGAGIEYEITVQNGLATMRTRDTTGAITIDVWEVQPSRVTKSIFENPIILANVLANDLAVIAKAFTGGLTQLADAVTALNADNPDVTYTAPDLATASDQTVWLWKQVTQGQDPNYFADQYTLKHTTSASIRGYYNVANTNVNAIYTQAQLYSEITRSGYWIFPCPAEIIGDLNTIFAGLPAAVTPLLQGALKGGSSRVTAANNRVNLTMEYLIENINTYEYALAY